MTKVLIVDDHPVTRYGLKQLLGRHFAIVGEAANGQEALDLLISGIEANIILTDYKMPLMDGLQLAQAMQENFSHLPLVFLTTSDDDNIIQQAFDNGIGNFVFKSADPEELLFALNQAAAGKRYLCSELIDRMIKHSGGFSNPRRLGQDSAVDVDFSKREFEVLELIAEGYTNEQAANKLFTSRRTVEGHRQAMLDKTGARNSLALIRFAMRNGLLT